jgi:hypothetical protein
MSNTDSLTFANCVAREHEVVVLPTPDHQCKAPPFPPTKIQRSEF